MLESLKRYLNISYEDPFTDEMLRETLERGKAVLDSYAGAALDYDGEGLPRQLLFDYCRYVRSHATEMFEQNFQHDLISLREMTEVGLYADQNGHAVPDIQ